LVIIKHDFRKYDIIWISKEGRDGIMEKIAERFPRSLCLFVFLALQPIVVAFSQPDSGL
jgi:hypothetical protein